MPLIVASAGHHAAARLALARILLGKELLAARGRGLDRGGPFLPVRRAEFAVLLEILQGLHHSQGFIDAAAQWQVVDHLVPHDPLLVDQKQAP